MNFRILTVRLLRSLVGLMIFAATCRGEAGHLNLLCWTEYIPQAVIEGFTKKTGIQVTTATYNSNEQMLAMLRAQGGFYDLVQPSQAYVAALIADDGLTPIDRAKIPNWRNLDPNFLGLAHDPENRFSVPWLSGTIGIVVDTEAVKKPIQTWADVFSGEYRGKIVVVNDQREMAAWALASVGLPITDISNENLTRIAPVLRQWLPQVAVFDSDSPHTALLDGRAVIGIVWSGEAALLWQQNRKFRYILPKEGAHMFLDSLAIPARAPHQAAAEAFIDYCLEPAVSVEISKAYPYTNPNVAARLLLTEEQLANPASYQPGNPKLRPLSNVGNDTTAVDEFVGKIRAETASRPGRN